MKNFVKLNFKNRDYLLYMWLFISFLGILATLFMFKKDVYGYFGLNYSEKLIKTKEEIAKKDKNNVYNMIKGVEKASKDNENIFQE